MSLQEITWFHPHLVDSALRKQIRPVHLFMGAPDDSPLTDHVAGRDGLIIEGSKHWEYAYAVRQAGLLETETPRADCLLDAGCGRSAFPAYLAHRGIRVVGLDLDRLRLAQFRPHGLATVQGNLDSLPFQAGVFDQVLCISVLEHTPDPLHCFDELWRVTRLGGSLTITGDYAPWGLPPRTMTAPQVMDHALLRRLVGSRGDVPCETPALLEGLGYFRQMWPTFLPFYLRFLRDTVEPPDHPPARALPQQDLIRPVLNRAAKRHLAAQCFRAARLYFSHDWFCEARLLFAKAWRLDRRLGAAFAWRLVARLPLPAVRALRRLRRERGRSHP